MNYINYNEIEDLDYCLKLLEERDKEIKKIREELLKYEIQNAKLQEELVRLRVNSGKDVILGSDK